MKDLIWRMTGVALLYGGPLLLALALVLGVAALLFRIRAPWFLWLIGACALGGVLLLAWAFAQFRGFTSRL